MKYKTTIFFCTFFFFFSIHTSAAVPDDGEIQYEKCDCYNNKVTKQLTEPYKQEIEQWLIQTASPEDQATEAEASCINCQIKSNNDTLTQQDEGFFNTIKNWYNIILRYFTQENTQSPPTPAPLPTPPATPNFIPSVCFQMSGQMTQKTPTSKRDFFTCIHKHYDGSDSDHFCADTVKKGDPYPKKCSVIPVPCEDVKNPALECDERFKNREDNPTANGCNRGAIYPRKPCLNEEYTAMTAKAFHDVAQCLNVPPDLVFSILNHESRFILNNESHTGALCYSQITSIAVQDFNQFLEHKPNYQNIDELLPENIKARCPEQWKHFQKVNTKYIKKQKTFRIKSPHDKCKLNINPYTCFFYGFSYIKILMQKAQQSIQTLNKIKIFKGQNKTSIFWGEKEKRDIEKKRNIKLQTEKIPIFQNEELLKKILITIGYNGGPTIPETIFKDYITYLKKRLSDKTNTDLRNKLLTKGLDIPFFISEFLPFISRNYPARNRNKKKARKRRAEVADYINKVNGSMENLNKNIKSKYPSSFKKDICSFL